MSKPKNKIIRDGFTWPVRGEYSLLYNHLYAEDSLIVGSRRNEMLRLMFVGFCYENGVGGNKAVHRNQLNSEISYNDPHYEGRYIGEKRDGSPDDESQARFVKAKTKRIAKSKTKLPKENDINWKNNSKTTDEDSVILEKESDFGVEKINNLALNNEIIDKNNELNHENNDDKGRNSGGFEFDPDKYCT